MPCAGQVQRSVVLVGSPHLEGHQLRAATHNSQAWGSPSPTFSLCGRCASVVCVRVFLQSCVYVSECLCSSVYAAHHLSTDRDILSQTYSLCGRCVHVHVCMYL